MATALYYLIVTPAALLYRLLRRDPLRLRPPAAAGYWTAPHRPVYRGGDFRQR